MYTQTLHRYPALRSSFFALFVALLLSLAFTAASAQERQPASPNEINAGQGVSPSFSLSNDGGWLAFNTNKGSGFQNMKTGAKANTGKGWSTGGATWAPTKSTLGMRVYREGKGALTLWDAGTDEATKRELLVFPRKLYPSFPTVWSADGKYMYFVINQNLPWPKSHPDDDNPPTSSNNVNLELTPPYRQKKERQRFEKEYPEAYAEGNRSLVIAVEVESGKWGVLAKGNDINNLLYLSPDGKRILAVQHKFNPPDRPPSWTKQIIADVYLIDIPEFSSLSDFDLEAMEDRKAGWSDYKGERMSALLKDTYTNSTSSFDPPNYTGTNGNPLFTWSPDSQRFAFATVGRQSTGDVYVYELSNKQLRNLTEKVAVGPWTKSLGYGEQYTNVYDSPKFGYIFPPLWLKDGSALVVMGRGDVWNIPVNGKAPSIITRRVTQEARRIVAAPNQFEALTDADGRIVVVTKDRRSRLDTVVKLNPVSGDMVKVADTGVWTNLIFDTASNADRLYYSGQSEVSGRNLLSVDLKQDAKPDYVTRYKMELAERVYPESRYLTWKTPDGGTGFGLLYLPRGASDANKVPLVVDGYPGELVSRIDVRAKNGASFYQDNLHGLLLEGFGVLFFDIPMSDEGNYAKPMKQMVDGVNGAVDAAIATGVVDESRMAIMGTSYGAVMVNSVITQTNRFKAAASISGLSDWFADYMGGGDVSGDYHEKGQGRFVKQLWEEPNRYVENSPITYMNKVETPLLIVHGEYDGRVPIRHAVETFRALDHLDKENVIFARYTRMGHGANPEASRRIRGWFREYLMGGERISHIAEQGSFMFGGSDDSAGEDGFFAPPTPAPSAPGPAPAPVPAPPSPSTPAPAPRAN